MLATSPSSRVTLAPTSSTPSPSRRHTLPLRLLATRVGALGEREQPPPPGRTQSLQKLERKGGKEGGAARGRRSRGSWARGGELRCGRPVGV